MLFKSKNKFDFARKKIVLKILVTFIFGINLVGYLGAYSLTNYRTKDTVGWGYLRPENKSLPTDFDLPYTSDRQSSRVNFK